LQQKQAFSRDAVERAVEEYNRYRSPEATVKLVKIENDEIVFKFTGPFCMTCGTTDWIEDMKFVLEDHGVNSRIVKVEETEYGFIATFKVEGLKEGESQQYSKGPSSLRHLDA